MAGIDNSRIDTYNLSDDARTYAYNLPDLPNINRTYRPEIFAERDFRIKRLIAYTTDGDCVVTVSINGTPVSGLENLNVDTNILSVTYDTGVLVSEGQNITVAVSGATDIEYLNVKLITIAEKTS